MVLLNYAQNVPDKLCGENQKIVKLFSIFLKTYANIKSNKTS